jgi:hypothetical protein
MVVNTSFNVMGETIVETPEDALWCMLSTGIEFCVLEDRLVRKRAGFRSLLDLVPRVVARRCTIDLALEDGQLGSARRQARICAPWWQRPGATSSRRSRPTSSRCCST